MANTSRMEWETDAQVEAFRAAVLSDRFSHARYREWCGTGVVWVYHSEPSSPSGVQLAAALSADLGERIIRECRRPGALSPTEGMAALASQS